MTKGSHKQCQMDKIQVNNHKLGQSKDTWFSWKTIQEKVNTDKFAKQNSQQKLN